MYEGNGKIFFILLSREKESLHLFGTFQGNSIKCIFGKLSARKDRRLQKQGVIRVKLRKRWGFQRGLGSLSIDCAFNSSTLWLHVGNCLQSGAHKQVPDKSRGVQLQEQFWERIFDDGIIISSEHPL